MEDLTGKQFGHYQIVEPLGEGGMAAVYKAFQPSMERYVAVKVLPRHMAMSEEFITRFKLEARLLAQLQHPHILSVFDYGESEGYTYIVMPYVQGGTLADLMKKRRFNLAEIREIVTQIGSALGYAHARGMVHRDVKPSNVLVDESGNCMLTDFGLARMIESTSNLTSTGAMIGTPAYMSPEQGVGKQLDGRSDIYSLGIIFFELLTGRVPYTAETPVAIVFKHIQDPLPSVQKINPDLPVEVELVLYKVLAKNPEDRYQTAEEFIRALQQIEIMDKPVLPSDVVARQAAADQQAREKAQREAAAKAAREQAEREAAEKISRQQASGTMPSSPRPTPEQIAQARVVQQPAVAAVPSRPIPQKESGNRTWFIVLGLIGLCLVLMLGLAFFGYQAVSLAAQQSATATANADATAAAIEALNAAATQKAEANTRATSTAAAKATSTAVAKATATFQAGQAAATAFWDNPLFSDDFKNNSQDWPVGNFDKGNSDYWSGTIAVVNGFYQYDVKEVRKPFLYWTLYPGNSLTNFDVSVDAKRLLGQPDQACFGLVFRSSKTTRYTFAVCDNQYYAIDYYDGKDYTSLRSWAASSAIKSADWNTLWVNGKGSTFTFYINGVKVDTITDSHLKSGVVGVFVEVFNNQPAKVQFDNFIVQKR